MSKTQTAVKSSKKTVVDAKELAVVMGLYQATIYRHVQAGKLPAPHIVDGKMTWTVSRLAKCAPRTKAAVKTPAAKSSNAVKSTSKGKK